MTFNALVREWAIKYINAGWYVFPCHSIDETGHCTCGDENCTDSGKHPVMPRGLKHATRDLSKIDEWWSDKNPPTNIGVLCGDKSGITVIDIDTGKGGAESWQSIIAEHGEPQTLVAKTGSGGMHLVFKYNSVLKTASNVLGKGIDCRNDGGYIIAEPSRHRSGGSYQWLNDIESELSSLPAHMTRRKETRGRPKKGDVSRKKYSLEEVKDMLEVIPSVDRDDWRHVGIILGREFNCSQEAWEMYVEWAEKDCVKKGRNHDEIMHEAFYDLSQKETSGNELSLGTIVKKALDNGWAPKLGEVPLEHFIYYAPDNDYIYRPTGQHWPSTSVDSAVSPVNIGGKIMAPTEWLRQNQLATSMTCDPAIEDDYIKGFDNRNGEIHRVTGSALFNVYRRPNIELGDSNLAKPFLEHCKMVFNKTGDCEQFLNYMAHRVQRPWEKPRFSLLIAGQQGIGKDTAIEFCIPAIGAWNVANIEPKNFEANYNEYAAATLVRISEAANLHEMSKWTFNEQTKVLIAGSPDVMEINPKYGKKFSIRLYCGVIITTNHLGSGIYIPADDRRYDVIDCATIEEAGMNDEEKKKKYFEDLWEWFLDGGDKHVAAFLNERDISGFSASLGQRKTEAHKTVVASGFNSDEWVIDILEELSITYNCNGTGLSAVRGDVIISKAVSNGEKDGDVRRKIGSALGRAGYQIFRCPATQDGRWRLEGKRTMVYVKNGTPANFDPNECKYLKELF